MSTFIVDANCQRVTTDVLIAGFTHEASKVYKIAIANEIIGVIFMFWYIEVCDEWDRSFCADSINIVGSCAKSVEGGHSSAFGKKIVEKGIFEWRLKFNTDINYCYIGIIRDNPQVLTINQKDNVYCLCGGGICLASSGTLYLGRLSNIWGGYSNKFTKKNTIITLTLDMDKKRIKYKINDKQYKSKKIGLSVDKYRLIVSFQRENDEIELL